jgi:transposase InsO family protein
MKTNTNVTQSKCHTTTAKAEVIKLGLDVHARQITVCRQLDDSTPQPPQRFVQAQLISWVKVQMAGGAKLYSCYEAGPLGYGLRRELTALGATNYVIAPQKLDGSKRQKTDRLDARALVERLDRHVRGNAHAFSAVRVPTPEHEQARARSRLREQLSRMRRQAEARGRSLLLTHGQHVEGPWWRPARWAALALTLPEWLRALVAIWQKQAQAQQAIAQHGAPEFIRSDNGAEFIAKELQRWLTEEKIKTIYIDPASPWQNGFVESFHGRFRDECLNREQLWTLSEARVVIEDFRIDYNTRRPHSRLGYRSPVNYAAQLHATPTPVGLRPPSVGDAQAHPATSTHNRLPD